MPRPSPPSGGSPGRRRSMPSHTGVSASPTQTHPTASAARGRSGTSRPSCGVGSPSEPRCTGCSPPADTANSSDRTQRAGALLAAPANNQVLGERRKEPGVLLPAPCTFQASADRDAAATPRVDVRVASLHRKLARETQSTGGMAERARHARRRETRDRRLRRPLPPPRAQRLDYRTPLEVRQTWEELQKTVARDANTGGEHVNLYHAALS
jgi:hypothetical protein